ncbi:MAG TPA: molybdopterin-synthase adenylyltransferase MoeB [Opitutaceae bacterium]|nr:molybdopterin-synthase adenylyltransferase MoeB [Opitutaceae bacterium]
MSDPLPHLSPPELARYSRHILLPEVGLDGQRKLAASRVLIIGAGGLGSPAALYLAAAGIGTIGLADFDRVEAHNLQRQLLHQDKEIGQPKVESAARRLAATNPHIKIELHGEGVTAKNALSLFEQYDAIVDGTDNFPTRYLNNDAAVLAKKPLVYGSIFRFEGQVSVFDPARGGPCYRCLFPEPPPPGSVPNCGEAGVLGALCGVIGSLQALETLKLILNIGESLRGRMLIYDALTQRMDSLTLPKNPDCPVCGHAPTIRNLHDENYDISCAPGVPDLTMINGEYPIEISIEETRQILDADPETILVDVREPYELEICKVERSVDIPMRQIPERMDDLPRDKRVLVMCHHGGRSLRVTEYLRNRGLQNVSNVQGGIDAWATSFDPAMRRY